MNRCRTALVAAASCLGLMAGLGGALSMQSARAAASVNDQPVPIPALTTAFSTTQDMPDGTTQTTYSDEPEQVQQAGKWVPIDTSLHVNSDGSFSPAATLATLRLSGGGSGPMASMANNGSTLALAWPTALPTPSVSGATATYASVMPGVDLELTATPYGGFSELLVVQDASAAANPALKNLTLSTTAHGLTLSTDQAGDVSATDSSGALAFHAPTPLMWDSAGVGTTAGQAATNTPVIGDQVAKVALNLTSQALSLLPSQSMLTSSKTQYPVYIDPDWEPATVNRTGFAWAQQANPDSKWYNDTSNGQPAVGYQGWQASYQGKNRAFFQFDVGSFDNKHIQSAVFSSLATDGGPYDCTIQNKYVEDSVTSIGPSTTWNNQPTAETQTDSENILGSSNANGCPNRRVNFGVVDSLRNDTNGLVTYRIEANDESDRNAYKRFTSTTSATYLTVSYNTPPNTPTGLSMSPKSKDPSTSCASSKSTVGWVGSTSQITFTANLSDPDNNNQQQHLNARFELWDEGASGGSNSSVIAAGDAAGASDASPGNGPASKSIGLGNFTNGHMYAFSAYAYDTIDQSANDAAPCYFRYDTTSPNQLSVTSSDFNTTNSTKHVRQSGTFTLSANDPVPSGGAASGVDHFLYSTSSESDVDSGGGTSVAANASGTASISLTPTTWGMNYLYVSAVDNAGNQSPAAYRYKFYVPDTAHTVHPGDVDGDGTPDILADNGSSGTLQLISGVPSQAGSVKPTPASSAINSPDGATWSNTLLAHRSSTQQSNSGSWVDDLWALKPGSAAGDAQLYLYTNNLNNAGGLAANGNSFYSSNNRFVVSKPTCVSSGTACNNYETFDWSDVTQLAAPGDVNGDGIPDLLAVQSGQLWLYLGGTTTGKFASAQLVNSSTNWNNWKIMAPGDSSGDGKPDIWAADQRLASKGGTGQLGLYSLTASCDGSYANCTTTLGSPAYTPNAQYGPDNFPLMTSPGDLDADGEPNLVVVTSDDSSLWTYNSSSLSPKSLAFNTHQVLDDNSVNWALYTNIS